MRVVMEDVGWSVVDIPCTGCRKRIILQYGKKEREQCCGYQYELQAGVINLFITEVGAELDKEAGKTNLLRSEVAYLRCVEDAARMAVNAANDLAHVEDQLKDLDEFREEFGYWHG